MKAWLEKKQGKFVTHDVQNKILTIMSNSVLRSLLKKIEGNIYSTMCDEYTDCSNHEQLTFCLRWVKALKAHKTLLGFYEIPDIKSSTVVSVIKDILTRYQLSMENFEASATMEPVTFLEKPPGLRWNSKSFSQKRIIHTVIHTPTLYPSKMQPKSQDFR